MRHIVALCAALVLSACRTAPVTLTESAEVSPTPSAASERPKASLDAVIQFLLTAAATDFHDHRPPDPLRFRDVRIGHVMTASGEAQYLLCGQFLPATEDGKAEWMAFATVQTAPYEQWMGAQALGACQRPAVVWDKEGDLASSLQSRLDSPR